VGAVFGLPVVKPFGTKPSVINSIHRPAATLTILPSLTAMSRPQPVERRMQQECSAPAPRSQVQSASGRDGRGLMQANMPSEVSQPLSPQVVSRQGLTLPPRGLERTPKNTGKHGNSRPRRHRFRHTCGRWQAGNAHLRTFVALARGPRRLAALLATNAPDAMPGSQNAP
jgi:hypothetical protein